MSKVTLLVEVDEKYYNSIKEQGSFSTATYQGELLQAIANGIPYEAPPKNDWIPVKSAEELPKDKMLWVTDVYGRVFELHFDMTEWSSRVDDVIAYKYKDKVSEAYNGIDMRGGAK